MTDAIGMTISICGNVPAAVNPIIIVAAILAVNARKRNQTHHVNRLLCVPLSIYIEVWIEYEIWVEGKWLWYLGMFGFFSFFFG
jgi:hypothetical protein